MQRQPTAYPSGSWAVSVRDKDDRKRHDSGSDHNVARRKLHLSDLGQSLQNSTCKVSKNAVATSTPIDLKVVSIRVENISTLVVRMLRRVRCLSELPPQLLCSSACLMTREHKSSRLYSWLGSQSDKSGKSSRMPIAIR